MDVKEAVQAAKAYVRDVFSEERPSNVGLEEIEYDESYGAWDITVGFSRPWDGSKSSLAALTGVTIEPIRSFKVVRVLDDGTIKSIKVREIGV